jgi:hypothetical protein
VHVPVVEGKVIMTPKPEVYNLSLKLNNYGQHFSLNKIQGMYKVDKVIESQNQAFYKTVTFLLRIRTPFLVRHTKCLRNIIYPLQISFSAGDVQYDKSEFHLLVRNYQKTTVDLVGHFEDVTSHSS